MPQVVSTSSESLSQRFSHDEVVGVREMSGGSSESWHKLVVVPADHSFPNRTSAATASRLSLSRQSQRGWLDHASATQRSVRGPCLKATTTLCPLSSKGSSQGALFALFERGTKPLPTLTAPPMPSSQVPKVRRCTGQLRALWHSETRQRTSNSIKHLIG
jgi:hypothetical protein